MAIEDFTTYTETDTGNDRLQKTANHIDIDAYRNEDVYLYDDKGVGHFDDFEHKVDVKPISSPDDLAVCAVWIVSNAINDEYGQMTAGNRFLSIGLYRRTGYAPFTRHFLLRYWDGSDNFVRSNTEWVDGTWYYLTIKRDGTAFTCKIYSDSDRTDLLETVELTVGTDTYRYIYPACTYNSGHNLHLDADIENLDLQEEAPSAGQPYQARVQHVAGMKKW